MSINLYYTEKGFGTPLVLLHGNGENGNYFKNQIDYFAEKYRVIAVDTRGHGKSPHGNLPLGLDLFADDLKYFLDSLNIKQADILGFSDGGNIALLFALKYPSYVKKLVLNSANLYPAGLKKGVLFPLRIIFCITSVLANFTHKAVRRKELLSLMLKEPNILPKQLGDIKCPTLVIAGLHDLIKENHTHLIAESLPNSRLCFLDGNHSVAKNNSVEFNKTVERFLEE